MKPDLIGELDPRLTGWFGLANPFEYENRVDAGERHEGVFKFLGGTPNVPALYAAREGLRIIDRVGVEAIREVSVGLTEFLRVQAQAYGVPVTSPALASRRNGMVCLRVEGGQQLVAELAEQGIVVDWRPDCGMRVSPHFYNTREDLDVFLQALRRRVQ